MSLFSGIGDFFRGAFGEDEEERKRRKQREQQEAAARKQQANQQRLKSVVQPQQSKPVDINKALGRQPTSSERVMQKLQQETKPVVPPSNKPQVVAQNIEAGKDYDFKGLETTGQKNKTILGWNAAAVLPKQFEKVDEVKVQGTVKTNKDKFVAAFDKMDEDRKKIYLNEITKQAQEGDQAAYNSLKALTDANRAVIPRDKLQRAADIASVPGRSIARVGTGVAQGVSGVVDLATPGVGTNRVSKGLDTAAKFQDESARDAEVEGAYKVGNVVGEVASYAIPSTLAVKIAGRFPKGAKLTDKLITQAANMVDDQGEANKLRQFLANRMRRNMSLEEALEESLISAKYTGENASKGNDTSAGSIATDIATGIGAGLLFPTGRASRERPIKSIDDFFSNAPEEITGSTLATGARAIDNQIAGQSLDAIQQSVAEKGVRNATEQELQALVNDASSPAFERQKYRDELARRANVQPQANDPNKAAYDAQRSAERGEGNIFSDMQDKGLNPGDPNDIPAYMRRDADEEIKRAQDEIAAIDDQLSKTPEQTIQEYRFNQRQQLARDIQANPTKRDALMKLYEIRMRNADRLRNLDEYRAQLEIRKQQLQQVIDNSNLIKKSTQEAVEDQATQTDEAIKAGQEAVSEAEATSAAQSTPNPSTVVEDTPATGSPELAANDARRASTEDVLYSESPTFDERENLSFFQRFSPDRFIRENITRPLENAANRGINALQTANNAPARGIGRLFTGFSREAGVDTASQTARMQLRGGAEAGKANREAIADLTKGVAPESRERIWATLDPEFAARLGKQVDQLSPEETVIQQKLKTIIDNTTAENLRRGLITPEQAASQSYIKRAYTLYDGADEAKEFERGFRQELMNQYKGRKEVSDEMVDMAITDPTYLVGKKTAESEAIWAMQDYGNFLAKNGTVIDTPKPGYTQLPDSPVFGDAAGKYVPRNVAEDFTGFQYNNAMVSAFNDLITAYDRLGVRQAKKQLLTVFNPAVRLGNQVTNRGIFANLSGVNPVQFNVVFSQVDGMIKQNHQLYREAVQQGLTGVDVTQADFYAQRIAQSAGQDKNMAKKAVEWFQSSYSGADDKARITSYVIKRQQGYSPEEAARMTQRSFQDYKSVGFFYDMAAKTPIIGNAFVRFAADSIRIAKNSAVDHPMRTMSTIALWNTFVNGMAVASGESEAGEGSTAEKAFNLATGSNKSDAQKEREGRFGSPKIPFTDTSLAVQTPWGEVNVARFAPWYSLNDISNTSVSKFLPVNELPIESNEKGGFQINPSAMQDPLLGQIVQLAIDKDFRGKSIQDPNINPDRPDQFREDPLDGDDKRNNALRFLFNNNMPLGRELDSLRSAATGQEDIYGKDRSVPQAIARALGFKVEEYGDKQREKNSSMQEYQGELETIEKELEGLSPTAQEAYKRISGYYKMREQVDNEFSPGDKRYKKASVYEFSEDKWKDYASHPELYDMMVDKKQREKAKDGKPVQPEFDPRLSEPFRRQLIANKQAAPGDDAELDQRMYASPEYDYYQALRDQYKEDAAKYFPESDNEEQFVDELVKHQDAKFPTKPDVLKQYGAAYELYTKGKAAKPEFTDALKAAKEQYNKQTLDWTNNERKARGLPAITWEVWNNPTFGFDESPSGFGFGFGGGGKQEPYGNLFGELTNFTGQVNAPKAAEAQSMPDLSRFFTGLTAGSGGGRAKPRIGASNRGA